MKKETVPTNYLYYTGIVCLFLLLKLGYTYSTTDHLLFLLSPTNKGIEWLTASSASYSLTEGFRHLSLSIIIDRSCSGFNFWLLSFSLLSLSTIRFYTTHRQKLLAVTTLLLISYVVTVLVNVSRILIAIKTLQYKSSWPFLDQAWLHEAQGAFIYLLFLIVLYITVQSITAKLTHTNAYAR
jgi:exosortase K